MDLTTNASLKKIEKGAFNKYFSSSIMEALKEDPTPNVTTIKVDFTTFYLQVSTCQCHERGLPIFWIFERQRGDIKWMESSRDNEIPLANMQENENSVNLNLFS